MAAMIGIVTWKNLTHKIEIVFGMLNLSYPHVSHQYSNEPIFDHQQRQDAEPMVAFPS